MRGDAIRISNPCVALSIRVPDRKAGPLFLRPPLNTGDVSFFTAPVSVWTLPLRPTSFRYFVVTACSLGFAEDTTCGFQSSDGTRVAKGGLQKQLFEIT